MAITVLRWSPANFWSATPHELSAADELLSGESKRADYARFKEEVEKGALGHMAARNGLMCSPRPQVPLGEKFFDILMLL